MGKNTFQAVNILRKKRALILLCMIDIQPIFVP